MDSDTRYHHLDIADPVLPPPNRALVNLRVLAIFTLVLVSFQVFLALLVGGLVGTRYHAIANTLSVIEAAARAFAPVLNDTATLATEVNTIFSLASSLVPVGHELAKCVPLLESLC